MTTIIKPKKTLSVEDLKEVWRYKELLYFFVWRDIKVRYKQTIVGIGWAVFQPFMTMVVFSVFFGKLINDGQTRMHYEVDKEVLANIKDWLDLSTL